MALATSLPQALPNTDSSDNEPFGDHDDHKFLDEEAKTPTVGSVSSTNTLQQLSYF